MRCSFRALAGRAARQPLLHRLEQLLHRDGLFEEGQCTDARGLDGRFDGRMTAHHDDGHGELAGRGPFLEQGDAVGIRHPDVQQHQIVVVGCPGYACLRGVLRHVHTMTFVVEDFRQQIPDPQFVVDH
ncbi:hypothetical protein SDC9_159018 [bioreactor metagenome]|uniref:Uncharacterized protein n=1 Tax=bioreactor metagenome TaxID=1076179 RepID=A0A645FBM8_9ZZZZ